jgi:hypothetical protein
LKKARWGQHLKAFILCLIIYLAQGTVAHAATLYGPISAAHTRLMQQFAVVQERKNWEASYRSKPTDYVLTVAWHVARAGCRCLTVEARAQSLRWLGNRGLRGVRINVYNGKLIIP